MEPKDLRPQVSQRDAAQNLSRKNTHTAIAATSASGPYVINPYQQYTGPTDDHDDDSSGGLLAYWRILLRNKRQILVGSLAGLLLGFAVGIPMKPKFRATTTLEVLAINGDFMNQKSSNPTTTSDNNWDTSEEQTQATLLQGTALLKRVIAKLDPGAPADPQPPPLATTGWRSWLHLRETATQAPKLSLLNAAAASVKVRPTARTRVLELTVDSRDPQLAKDFANTLTQEYIAQTIEARWATVQITSEWLHRELDEARSKLRASEDALQNYASTSGLIFTDESTNAATEKLQQVQENLSAATADRIAKQSRYELAQHAPSDSLGDVLNDASLRDTLAKITETKRQLAEQSAVFAPESNRIQRVQAELDALQSAFDHQRADIVTHIKNDYLEAQRKEELLAAAYQTQAGEVTGQGEKAIQYNILKRDVESNRSLYDTMLQQMKQASIASAIRAGNVRVVDAAELPESPISPNFKINSAIGLFLGLFSSVILLTIRERADRTLQQPGDIKQWTQLIELGAIPNAAIGHTLPTYYRRLAKTETSTRNGDPASAKNTALLPSQLIVSKQSSTASAEAFRSALTSMLFVSEDANRPQVIVFTSANPADGKTTVTSNMAIAAAEIRLRVLMIDADLRRPSLHETFKLPNDIGLSDILSGQVEESGVSELIVPTGLPNLYMLTAGSPTQAASHLLYSPMWDALLQKLRQEYDLILVDTPPVLQMPDARITARKSDTVVLVARSNLTTRDALLAVKETLTGDRIPILGAMLNDWDPKKSSNGYYGYYGHNYYGDYANSR